MNFTAKQIVSFFISLLLCTSISFAAPQNQLLIPQAPNLNAKSFILMDYNSGQIVAAKNIHDQLPPASLTKLMTLYVVFGALQSGQLQLTDKVHISKIAWKTGGSKMFVKAGDAIPIKDLIQGVIVDSGNDATVALAEYLADDQKDFVPLMNQQARNLGMNNTHYADVNGLPMNDHYTSAYDLALLTRAIIQNYPNQYHWFKQKSFTWEGIKQSNRNWLLFRDTSVDGLKTGHTEAAGYCLVSSADRNGMRLIAVVMGTPTEKSRINESERLLNYGFRFFQTYKIYSAEQTITSTRVWGGSRKKVDLGLEHDLSLTIPKGQYKQLQLHVQLNGNLKAPIQQGQSYGSLQVTLAGKIIGQKPLVALQADPKGGIFSRTVDAISLTAKRIF